MVKRFRSRIIYIDYFGTKVYSPSDSHLLRILRSEAVFEAETIGAVLRLIKPSSLFIDVGANIGLMSVPILAVRKDVHVVSVEATPSTIPYLSRTRESSSFRDRWMIVGEAVGSHSGEATFFAREGAFSAFDGLANTGRGGRAHQITVTMTTIDKVWISAGRHPVSVIKLDIEGAESEALEGAAEVIGRCQPGLILEWCTANLAAYHRSHMDIYGIAERLRYTVCSVPGLVRIEKPDLESYMAKNEMIVLLPEPS